MDVQGLIESFLTGTYTVTRVSGIAYVNGRASAGSTSTLSIDASVHPAAGNDLLRLPEGQRTIETRIVFTTTELKEGSEGSTYKADKVSIDGALWEVQTVESWRPDPGTDAPYFRCIVQAVAT